MNPRYSTVRRVQELGIFPRSNQPSMHVVQEEYIAHFDRFRDCSAAKNTKRKHRRQQKEPSSTGHNSPTCISFYVSTMHVSAATFQSRMTESTSCLRTIATTNLLDLPPSL